MKILSADTWTLEELRAQVNDAGRRPLLIPAADSKKGVLQAFGEALAFPEHYGLNLDALNDSLNDFADTVTEDGQAPATVIWQVSAPSGRTAPSASSARSCRTPNGTPARTSPSSPSASDPGNGPPVPSPAPPSASQQSGGTLTADLGVRPLRRGVSVSMCPRTADGAAEPYAGKDLAVIAICLLTSTRAARKPVIRKHASQQGPRRQGSLAELARLGRRWGGTSEHA